MIEIIHISEKEYDELLQLLHNSFLPVAREFNITQENSKHYTAFISMNELVDSIHDGLIMYGAKNNGTLVGSVGIKKSKTDNRYYIEKLGVDPKFRHNGIGKSLLDYAVIQIVNAGGKEITIGIIDDNDQLKGWYYNNGFIEYEIKQYDYLPFAVSLMKMEI